MSFFDDFTFGCYLPGDSFLHRLDARVKLVVLALLVMVSFAASRALQLGALSAIALGGLALGHIPLRRWWRGIWALRWLLLCTLLLHTLLTPGHTLGGIPWLSRDGLLQGSLVCGRLALAVTFSSLMTFVTPPAQLVAALMTLVRPLARLGMPIRRYAFLLKLVLDFIPLLKNEIQEVTRHRPPTKAQGPLMGRIELLRWALPLLLQRLVTRADELAQAYAQGRLQLENVSLPPFASNRWNLPAAVLGLLLPAFVLMLQGFSGG